MFRLMACTLSVSAGIAAAGTVQFVPAGIHAGPLDGVRTSADLSADASTFTITLHNHTGSGVMTAFYIESGAAITGLSSGSIDNGSGVHFTTTPFGGRDHALGSASRPAGTLGGFASVSGQTSIGGPLPTGNPGMNDAMQHWSGTFFSMVRAGGLTTGQATGESVSLTFAHDGSFSLSNLLRAMAADEIRFVQRYQNYGVAGESGYLGSNIAVVVPLPPAAWAGLGTLAVLAGAHRIARRVRR